MHTVHGDIFIQMVPMMNMQIFAQQLLTNTIDNVGTETRRSVSLENTILDVHADETLAHDIVLLTEHLKYARSKKTATGASKKALFRCHYAGIWLRCTARHVQCVYHTTPGKW